MLEQVDWPTVISGAGVFLTTSFLTWKGWQDRKKELAKPEPVQIVGGVIQGSAAMHANTEAMKDLTAAINRQSDLMMLTAAIGRLKNDD